MTEQQAIDLISQGITPRVVEKAWKNGKEGDLEAGMGLPPNTIKNLARRWGIGRKDNVQARW